MTAFCYSGTIQDVKSNIALKLDVKLTEGEPKASALVSPRMHQHSDDTVLQQGIAMLMFEAARYAALYDMLRRPTLAGVRVPAKLLHHVYECNCCQVAFQLGPRLYGASCMGKSPSSSLPLTLYPSIPPLRLKLLFSTAILKGHVA